jgi:phospholipid-binding lipoprotein MlaA
MMRKFVQRLIVTGLLLESACSVSPPGDASVVATAPTTTQEAAGPATAPVTPSDGPEVNVSDPAERTNRKIFGFNMAVDHAVTKPVATAYVEHVPEMVREGVHNFTTNLGEPKVLVNDVLQGNVTRALYTTGRFVMNSTAGVAGLIDVAGQLGLPHHEADFGQTFGVWGVGTGPAVQLPLFGSSNVRDSVGMVVGFVADPLSYVPGGAMTAISVTGAGGGMVDGRAQLLDASNSLEKTSLDYYATLRSINSQRRAALVQDGRDGAIGSLREIPVSSHD